MSDFMECRPCRAKAGSSELCRFCLNNRAAISERDAEIERLTAWKAFVLKRMHRDDNHFEQEKPYRHWFALFSGTKNPDKAIERALNGERDD